MKIERASLETCHQATGAVVVIDVLRAFTTAAFAFAAGARCIVPVGEVDEALALRARIPGALLMGEDKGTPLPGFDFGNSPAALINADLRGRCLIQRTTAGTQGIVRSIRAGHLLAASFCCARATARYLGRLAPEQVTFVETGLGPDGWGDEDVACADYIAALLRGRSPDVQPFIRRVRESAVGRVFMDPTRPEFQVADLECCVDVDRFDFAMRVERRDGLPVMEAVK